jgi:hypothetical protein
VSQTPLSSCIVFDSANAESALIRRPFSIRGAWDIPVLRKFPRFLRHCWCCVISDSSGIVCDSANSESVLSGTPLMIPSQRSLRHPDFSADFHSSMRLSQTLLMTYHGISNVLDTADSYSFRISSQINKKSRISRQISNNFLKMVEDMWGRFMARKNLGLKISWRLEKCPLH